MTATSPTTSPAPSRAILDSYGYGDGGTILERIDLGQARGDYARHMATRPDHLEAHGTKEWETWCYEKRRLSLRLEIAEAQARETTFMWGKASKAPDSTRAGKPTAALEHHLAKYRQDHAALVGGEWTPAEWKRKRQALYNLWCKIRRFGYSHLEQIPALPCGRPKK